MSFKHWLTKLLDDLVAKGWDFRVGRGHVVVYPIDKTKPCITISSTPGDRNAQKQIIRDLKKAGYTP